MQCEISESRPAPTHIIPTLMSSFHFYSKSLRAAQKHHRSHLRRNVRFSPRTRSSASAPLFEGLEYLHIWREVQKYVSPIKRKMSHSSHLLLQRSCPLFILDRYVLRKSFVDPISDEMSVSLLALKTVRWHPPCEGASAHLHLQAAVPQTRRSHKMRCQMNERRFFLLITKLRSFWLTYVALVFFFLSISFGFLVSSPKLK